VGIGDEGHGAARRLVAELRDAGVPVTRSFEDRPLKAQLKMADRAGAAFVAILGERELAERKVTLRRLADGIQKSVPAADAARWLTRLDDWTQA
jgi:histidyl-tRNA synthetase